MKDKEGQVKGFKERVFFSPFSFPASLKNEIESRREKKKKAKKKS